MRNLAAVALFFGAMTMGAGCSGQGAEASLGEDQVSDGKADGSGKSTYTIYNPNAGRYLTTYDSFDTVTTDTVEQPDRYELHIRAMLNIIHLEPGDTMDATIQAGGNAVSMKLWFRQSGSHFIPANLPTIAYEGGTKTPCTSVNISWDRGNEQVSPNCTGVATIEDALPGAVKGVPLEIGIFPVPDPMKWLYGAVTTDIGRVEDDFDYKITAKCTFDGGPEDLCNPGR